ncbi:MAG TPA: discoidin domain-containing protein [Thermoanaerobaculia bacterium]
MVTNGVHDLTGHPLGATRGFGFTTSDYAEPRVLKALPASPIPPSTTFEFRFNEPIAPGPWQQGGNGDFHVYKLLAPGGAAAAVDRELVGHTFLDANNIILYIALDDAVTNRIEPESFYRVTFKGVKDPQGNAAADQVHHFYSYDEVKPFVVFNTPAEGQQLVAGAEYEVTLGLRNGNAGGTPATDIKEVRWYTIDAQNKAVRFATVAVPPYSVKIAPGGSSFTIAAEATDTSGNISTLERRTWTVRPNEAPKNVVVTPLQASAYPSMAVSAKVTFEDEGSFVSMLVTFSTPKNDGTTDTQNFTRTFFRTTAGAWPEASFTYTIPANARGGENVTVTAVVSDAPGLSAPPASATIGVTVDTVQPQILLVSPPPGTTFTNTTKYVIEATVRDAETGVQSVSFFVDGTSYATASSEKLANGQQKFRSVQIETKSKADDAEIPIVVTAKDYNNNIKSTTFDVRYLGVNDPDAPKVTWLCPTDGAALPSNAAAFALKLRLRVIDQDVRSVQFVIASAAGSQTVTGAVTGTNEYGATHTFTTPAAGTLTVTAIVEDTVATHKVELPIALDVIDADVIVKDPLPITAAEAAQYNGKTLALIGTGAQLLPQVPLTLANLLVLNGARVETLPTDINREFRLNITTTGVTYVDCDSSIDVSDKGYVGGWRNTAEGQNANLRGRTVGNTTTGGADHCSQGSHGGLGGIGTCGTSNAPYGSINEPVDLGSGGGGSATCCNTGASGGGAIALRGGSGESDKSRIVIAGKVRADGGHGFIGGIQHAAGSGGSVLINAKQLLLSPNALVSANGGDDDGSNPGSWGAGGGRVSIGASTRLELSTAVVEARGGRDHNQPEVRQAMGGGAGTVLIRKPGQEHGELTVSAFDSRFANTTHTVRHTPLGRIGKGTSTALAANALTDAARTFDRWMVGEHLVLGGNTTKPYTVVAVSADGKTLQTDPADGSMLAANNSQAVAYAGLLVFDKITAGKRAVLVFDEHVSTAGAVDDKTVMLVDPTAAVALAVDPATLTLTSAPAAGGNIIRDTSLSVTYTAAAPAGVARVQFAWSPTSPAPVVHDYHDVPNPTASRTFTLPVPAATPLGEATLIVTVTDRAGRTTTFPARTYQIVTNAEPVLVNYTLTPGLSIHAGRDVVATVNVSDDIAIKTISFEAKLNGVSVKTQSSSPNTPTASATFTVPVAVDVAGGSTLEISLTVSDGFAGRAPLQGSQTVTILPDTIAPQITVTSPAAGASYKESVDKIPVRVTAVDAEVKTKEAFAQLEGGSILPLTLVANTNDWRADILAPPVDGDMPIQRNLVITAKDYAGNTRTSDPISITFTPVVDASAPKLTWMCGAAGAMFPAGGTIKLRVSAQAVPVNNQPNPVQVVEMYVNDATTSLTVTQVPNTTFYDATYVIPAGTAEGTAVNVRAIARSAGGAASDRLTTFTVIVPDATISSTMNIEANNTAYDNKTLVINAGTVTIRGPHTFDRLIVMGGASVVHDVLDKLALTTTRGLYVGCDSSIDGSSRGYGHRQTYPGETPVNDDNAGGSHIGKGGEWNVPGSTYGSIYRPQEHGAGGNNIRGGGVIRIQAKSVVVDGTIAANGASRGGGAAAGGSVWITADRVGGGGTIEANGGRNTDCCSYAGGGGGAVAIEYTDPTAVLPVLRATTFPSVRNPGAGTVWVMGPSSTYGDLIVDNNSVSGNVTWLPALGGGTAAAGTAGATLVTDRAANIQTYFAGHWVEIARADGTLKGTWRVDTVTANSKTVTLRPNGSETIALEPGDKWQGVYVFDNVRADNGAKLYSPDPFRGTTLNLSGSNVELQTPLKADTVNITGTVAAFSITAKNLTIETGATVKQVSAPGSLTLNVENNLIIRGNIDVTALGYGHRTTYPGETAQNDDNAGGSHMGKGGEWNVPGSTYGSVYRPQENGNGGNNVRGGGVVKINAGTLLLDGNIYANGASRGGGTGAGGSVWISAGRITGTGVVEALGGRNTDCCSYGGGGGGAISVEYSDPNTVLPTLRAYAQPSVRNAGAGTIYVKGADATYGDLRVDNNGLSGNVTVLPSLGSGTAIADTIGATLVTSRATNVQPYFAGHWVEITSVSGTVKGLWRIGSVTPNSKTVTLEPNGSETISLEPGDQWQALYLFDEVTIGNQAKVVSNDPIRAAGLDVAAGTAEMRTPIQADNVTVRGTVHATGITAKNVTVAATGVLRQYDTPGSLVMDVENTLTVLGAIDVSSQGYGHRQTYPGETAQNDDNAGGSHIGKGGEWNVPGSAYGSVYRPQENGNGGNTVRGGGVLKITAGAVAVDGAVRANGASRSGGTGAGGSIWISTGKISGTGTIEANGGRNTDCCSYAGGGGGAVAIEYTDPTSVLPALRATAIASSVRHAGAGSVYVKGAGATYGDLIVDNEGVNGNITELPAFGSGTAAAGTSGATLVTNRSANVQPYFAGHWIEVTSATGTVKGLWRVAEVVPNSKTITLGPNGSETITLQPGDTYRGVYLFDHVRAKNLVKLLSNDPIRAAGLETIGSNVELRSPLSADTTVIRGSVNSNGITGKDLTVEATGTLRQYHTPGELVLDIENSVNVLGAIDVTGQGYGHRSTYPDERPANDDNTGGAHIGSASNWGVSGSSYGSVYRAQENGAGGNNVRGGGVVKITTKSVNVTGAIRSNGAGRSGGTGAGGSIWIRTQKITGTGTIETNGGRNTDCCSYGGGGGGAVSIEYTDPTSVVPNLRSTAAANSVRNGGPGSVYVKGATSTYGSLTIDAENVVGQATQLPAIGMGSALAGTSGATVVTDAPANFQPYFAGHWIDVDAPNGTRKGTWRIKTTVGKTFTLEPNAGETIAVQPGDAWRGVYLFDMVTLRNRANVQLLDGLRGAKEIDSTSTLTANDPPVVNPGLINVESSAAGDFIVGTIGAVQDLHHPIVVTIASVRTGVAYPTFNANADGSFRYAVTGEVGDTFTIRARDSFSLTATSRVYPVTGAIAATNAIDAFTITPYSVVGGGSVTGAIRMRHPVRRASEGVITLLSSHAQATMPATVTIPVGSSVGSFTVTTSAVSQDTSVQVTASNALMPSVIANFDILAGTSALTDLQLAQSSVEGGTSVNATAFIAAPSFDGVVYLSSSDTRLASVPDHVFIASGATSVTFTVTTYGVAAAGSVQITAMHGGSKISRPLGLTKCTALGTVAAPAAPSLGTVWIDDTLPAGATQTGDGVLDSTQFATGSSSIHLSGAAAGKRTFAFTGGAALTVAPTDSLVFYALVNPCNPARELVVSWTAGTTEYTGAWGESRIARSSTVLAYQRTGALPRGGQWTRIEVPAKSLGITASTSITGFSVRAADGEAWIDSVGRSTCAIPNAPAPEFQAGEQVWFDDELPAGAVVGATTSAVTPWQWSTDQVASGSRSHVQTVRSGTHEHYFTGATEPLVTGNGDVLFAYVFLDPCNPPRQLMLEWYDGTWEHKAYWGDNLVPTNLIGPTRTRMGPMPETGKWVRLEVPVGAVNLKNNSVNGMAFAVYDGQAWFDRPGKLARVNLALNKTASQSSTYSDAGGTFTASRAVDGNLHSPMGASITNNQNRPWWQVDLGAVYPIDIIDIHGRTDCCQGQTSAVWVYVSDTPFTSTDPDTTFAQPGVSTYAFPGTVNELASFAVNRTGRYVRIQSSRTDHLTLPEVQVWAPIAPVRVNHAGGLRLGATAINQWDANAHPAYAVNGSANYGHGSGGTIYHTQSGAWTDPWYDLDLGAVSPIGKVDIWPRIDCCPEQSTNMWVFVSDTPFDSKSFATTFAQAGVSSWFHGAFNTSHISFPVNRTGRYVRVARAGTSTSLQFAELQVWSQQSTLPAYSRQQESPPER